MCAAIVLGASILCGTLPARAADLSKEIRTATDPDLQQYTAEVTQYVADQVSKISQDTDPKETSTARQSLIDNVGGLITPSSDFLDLYSNQLKNALAPLFGNPNIRVRLNAAIVVAVVAQKSQSSAFLSLVLTELKDPSEAVVLWALKAAHDLIPQTLGVPTLKVQMLNAVTRAAQRLATGPIVAAAYNALAIDQPGTVPNDLIQPIESLLSWRIGLYAAGAPPEPPADTRATVFLTSRNVWLSLAQKPSQQKAILQLVINLMAAAITDLPTAQPDDRDQLISLLNGTGGSIYAIGVTKGDEVLKAAALQLTAPGQSPTKVTTSAANAVAALATDFPGLTIPKVLAATAPAPAPSTPTPAPSDEPTP